MKQKKLFLILALLCAVVQGAWAQASWEEVYTMTNTTAADWTPLNAGSTTGRTLGASGTTTYLYANGNLSFTNSTAGGSGLTILGTVYLYVPEGVTVTCTGADANGQTGAGAGIELAEGNSLFLLGKGTLNAMGGNAANGSNGTNGGNAGWDKSNYWSGTGGTGGNGGGGAGAGIGTRGGQGGQGGAGADRVVSNWKTADGRSGEGGQAGAAGALMGHLDVAQSSFHLTATGGAAASQSGSAGDAGRRVLYDGDLYNWSAAGGGGGGGGGFGGAATGIGTGGPGGGGGGGGASSNLDWASKGYYVVKAPGGKGGQNADETWAEAGAESIVNYIAIFSGDVEMNVDYHSWDYKEYDYDDYISTKAVGAGGSGGAAGTASRSPILDGTGTELDPYLISSKADWVLFALNISNGNSYSGQHVKLTSDIDVITMAGTTDHPFQGIFDGGGHTLTFNKSNWEENFVAPFRYVGSCTIRNLHTAGSIGTSQQFAAGIISYVCTQTAAVTIENCRSSVVLSSSLDYNSANGGLIGATARDCVVKITGCVFYGSFENAVSDNNGGFVGWTNEGTRLTIENSLFAPSNLSTQLDGCHTWARGTGAVTLNNCYYTQAYGPALGTYCISTNDTPSQLGSLVHDYGMVKAYANGIFYDGQSYMAPAILTGRGTAWDPYPISSTYEWDSFVHYVNGGNTYSGQYLQLVKDISVSTMVSAPFSGTFLGNGYTITANITDTSNGGTALFHNINGATIKNLTVAGTITGGIHAAAIVGEAYGTGNLIEGCVATATVSGGSHIGGILGHGNDSEITISGCVFSGTLSGGGTAKGVFFGWGNNGGTKVVANCLYLMADGQDTRGLDLVRRHEGTVSVTNCYKSTTVGSNAKQCFAFTTAPANLGHLVQNCGRVKAYTNGILYDDTYYVALSTITLADNAANSTAISNANGYFADVALQDRKLYRDESWNTLCLPFNLDNLAGTPLQGAIVKTLESTDFTDGTLTMNFTEDVTAIEAGKPYIVKWKKNIVDISKLSADYTAQDCDVLTGTLSSWPGVNEYRISVAAGATVTLQDVAIKSGGSHRHMRAGINCLGDATIILKGTNTMKGFYLGYPGIHVPSGSTLTIKGSGSLTASGRGDAAGIGGGTEIPCGNIVIEGGTINAYGGFGAAGIGGGRYATCGDITITDGVTKVYAERGAYVGAIGRGDESTCGTVTIGGEVKNITASTYTYTGTGSGSVDVAVPNLVNPVFKSVINSDAPANIETDYVDFVGTYSPVSIYTDEKTNLYLGADNKLYYPTATDFQVNAFRGYFQLKGLTASESSNSNQASVRAFKLNFGDDEATGIISIHDSGFMVNGSDMWYTLDGRKLQGKPTQRGIYINNGKKVAIK